MFNTSILWTSLEASVITGGRSTQDWSATGICLKAQDVMPGDLFFSAQNDDLETVFRKGAVAAVVPWNTPDHEGWPMLKVPDVFVALWDLAKAARYKTHADIIAVQGLETRNSIASSLHRSFDVHTAGRHLSQGLASMPEMADFAVFGCAPHIRPDFVVITDCHHVDGSVFDDTQPSGRVLITSDQGDINHVIAKARAAGIRNIFTFGHGLDTDAHIIDVVQAMNGVRVQMKILDDVMDFVFPAGAVVTSAMLATALILKLSEQEARSIVSCLAGDVAGFSSSVSAAQNNVTLMRQDVITPSQAAFRVVNMIDTGMGRRTAVLDNVSAHYGEGISLADKNIKIPNRLDGLNLMFACKHVPLLRNAENTIRENHASRHLGEIVTDVLRPGDFVTFKGLMNSSCSMIASALRNVNPSMKKMIKADHAV